LLVILQAGGVENRENRQAELDKIPIDTGIAGAPSPALQ
jgi:hypothetical protein